MKTIGRPRGTQHTQFRSKRIIECSHPALRFLHTAQARTTFFRDFDMGRLGKGMHPGIGAARSMHGEALPRNDRDSSLQSILNSTAAKLALPATESCAVIGHYQAKLHGMKPAFLDRVGIEPVLEDLHGGGLIDHLALLAAVASRFLQPLGCSGGRQAFIPENDTRRGQWGECRA